MWLVILVTEWTIWRYTPKKRTVVKGLFHTADLIFLTATIDEVEPMPGWIKNCKG